MAVVAGLILAVKEVGDHTDVVMHPLELMDTCWMGKDLDLVALAPDDIDTVLIIDFNTVKTDIEEVTVRSVEVKPDREANRHCYWFILLVEVYTVVLSIKTLLNWDDIICSPTLLERYLDLLTYVHDVLDGTWSNPQCDSFLWGHELVIYYDSQLFHSSE